MWRRELGYRILQYVLTPSPDGVSYVSFWTVSSWFKVGRNSHQGKSFGALSSTEHFFFLVSRIKTSAFLPRLGLKTSRCIGGRGPQPPFFHFPIFDCQSVLKGLPMKMRRRRLSPHTFGWWRSLNEKMQLPERRKPPRMTRLHSSHIT